MTEAQGPSPDQREVSPNSSRMEINPVGARIDSLVLKGKEIIGKVIRGDGNEASTHPCTPVFGPVGEEQYGLSQHGNARKKEWNTDISEPNKVVLSHDIDEGNYPSGMHVTQTHELLDDGSYRLVTVHTNNNQDTAMPVNFAEHIYWLAPNGWEGVKVNNNDVTDVVKEDRAIPWQADNSIEIPGQPKIRVHQEGLPYVQGWAGKDENGMFDTNYAALEPCELPEDRFGTEESMIPPGESRTTSLVVSIVE